MEFLSEYDWHEGLLQGGKNTFGSLFLRAGLLPVLREFQ